jgi:hypothetical protein
MRRVAILSVLVILAVVGVGYAVLRPPAPPTGTPDDPRGPGPTPAPVEPTPPERPEEPGLDPEPPTETGDGLAIRGRVIWRDDADRHVVSVSLFRGIATADEIREVPPDRRITTHAGLGFRYEFEHLSPGPYSLRLEAGLRRLHPVAVMLGEEDAEQDLVLTPPGPAGVVYLRVLGPDGEDLGDAVVGVNVAASNRRPFRSGTVGLLEKGRYRIGLSEEVDPAALEDLRLRIWIRSRELGLRTVEVRPAETRDVTVRFEDPARLVVAITGYAGSGLEGRVTIALVPAGEEDRSSSLPSDRRLDERGRVAFHPIAPGPHVIHVLLQPTRGERYIVTSIPVTLPSGETVREVDVPPLHPLTVVIEGERRMSDVRLVGEGDPPIRLRSPPLVDGKIVFEGLPAGTYTLSGIFRAGRTTVRVPETSEVRLELKLPNAVRVEIFDPDGLYARAGLRTGDIVLAVDGKLLAYAGRFPGLVANRTCLLTVRRGERTVEIPVDTRPLHDDRDVPGARFDPAVR